MSVVENIFVHTDDTCSALETFSDSELYKFTFYIYIYITLSKCSVVQFFSMYPAIGVALYVVILVVM